MGIVSSARLERRNKMLTRKGSDALMRRIWESGGLTPDMEDDLKRLQGELDEREGMLRRYGEWYDGEDKEEFEYTPRDYSESDQWKGKYEEMRERYINRFFGRDPQEAEEIEEKTIEETTEQKDTKSFDEMLKKSDVD